MDTTSDWIALSAIVIAVGSLFVTAQQAKLTRRHNRLSVRPVLNIYRMEFNYKPIEYLLRNQGLGPATITSFEIYLDDKIIVESNGNLIYEFVGKLEINREEVTGHLICTDEPISSGQDISLVKFKNSSTNKELHDRLVSILPRVKFKIIYKSMYEETFSYFGNGS